jgi:hypothetical protein
VARTTQNAILATVNFKKTNQLVRRRRALAKRPRDLLGRPLPAAQPRQDVHGVAAGDVELAVGEPARRPREVHDVELVVGGLDRVGDDPLARDGLHQSLALFRRDLLPICHGFWVGRFCHVCHVFRI